MCYMCYCKKLILPLFAKVKIILQVFVMKKEEEEEEKHTPHNKYDTSGNRLRLR